MPYTDWINTMNTHIIDKENLSIIEFGLGQGTEFLLKSFKSVFSYELMNTDKWYKETVKKLSSHKNWSHKLVLWSEIKFKDYDTNLPTELLYDIDKLFEKNNYDVVFMDGGYHVRGDIVNYIINKFFPKYIVIHDVNFAFNEDGYNRIFKPSNYNTETDSYGEGTTIFIKEN
jgi:hypothetical protein